MKDITECRERLHGLFNITTTPFTADGAFDFRALARSIERVIGLGFDGILIGGTYGEFPAMSVTERADLFRYVMDVVGDRVPVMLCSAGSDPRDVRALDRARRRPRRPADGDAALCLGNHRQPDRRASSARSPRSRRPASSSTTRRASASPCRPP